MKQKQNRPKPSKQQKGKDIIGPKTAPVSSIPKEEVAMELESVHPIDTLLVQQLENILGRERELRVKYSKIDSSTDTPETRMAVYKELSVLNDRADRLYRLMSAMEYYGPYEVRASGLNSTAVA